MRIEIRLNEICNYNCPYCEDLHKDTPYINIDFVNLEKVLKQFEDLQFFIFGGEPTLHPQLLELIGFISHYSNNIIIQTNGSKPKIINKIIAEYDDIKINYSLHTAHSTLKQFLKNINPKNLNEIAVMDYPRTNLDIYKKLKIIFKNKVQYYPILPKNFNVKTGTPYLKSLENEKDFKYIKDDWSFIKMANGYSNYDIWRDDIQSINKICRIEFSVIYFQDNIVYKCFNDIFNNINGDKFKDFVFKPFEKKCHNNICYFDNQYWR